MKLTNRTILITGGTSGIGLELAKRLSERGNTVIVTGRDAGKLEAARRAVPGIHIVQSDVSDPAAIAALYDTVVAQHPALDTLINNAGIMRNLNLNQGRGLTDVTREIEINLSGPVRMVQQFLPHLRARPHALIVNVSSGLAFVPLPISPVYSATKAAVDAITKSLAAELGPKKIRVNALNPGLVETEGTHTAGVAAPDSDFRKDAEQTTPLGRIGQPDDIASVAVFLASNDSAWVTGESLRASGGRR